MMHACSFQSRPVRTQKSVAASVFSVGRNSDWYEPNLQLFVVDIPGDVFGEARRIAFVSSRSEDTETS